MERDISEVCYGCKLFKAVVVRDDKGRPDLVYCKHSMTGCEKLNEYLKGEKK